MPQMDTDGGRKPRVTDKDILAVFRKSDDPVLSTAEVADAVPIKRRGTLNRLQSLKEKGALKSKKIGGRNTIWWPVIEARESPKEPVEEPPDQTDHLDDADRARPTTAGENSPTSITDAVDRVAEGWDDAPDRLKARKDAARAVLEYARKHGTVSKQEAKEEVYPDHPVEGQNPRTWYRKNVRPVLNEAAEYDKSARAYRLDLRE